MVLLLNFYNYFLENQQKGDNQVINLKLTNQNFGFVLKNCTSLLIFLHFIILNLLVVYKYDKILRTSGRGSVR